MNIINLFQAQLFSFQLLLEKNRIDYIKSLLIPLN